MRSFERCRYECAFLAGLLFACFYCSLSASEIQRTTPWPSVHQKFSESKRRKAELTAGDIAGYSPFFNGGQNRNARLPKGTARSAVRDLEYRWPNGEIPYTMSDQYDSEDVQIINEAMDEIEKKTCVRFISRGPQRMQQDYVYIEPADGCYSFIGRVGGAQQLSLAPECIEHGTIVHELMHAIGFIHEQSRSDRDRYVKVLWKNIISGREEEFTKQDDQAYDTLGFPYDYSSIMHYGLTAFSRNGKPVMELLRPNYGEIGQRDGLTIIDAEKINRLYNCHQQTAAVYSKKEEVNEFLAIFLNFAKI